jgi:subtilisin family serine protease
MNRRVLSLCLLLFSSIFSATAQPRLIVRVSGGSTGIRTICGQIGCNVVRDLGDPSSQLFLVTVPSSQGVSVVQPALLRQAGVINVELDSPATVLQAGVGAPAGLLDRAPVSFYGATVWNGYATQPAANVIRAGEARGTFGVRGSGTVAVIDTGVDPYHPALKGVLVAGYDFTRDQSGMAPETADLNQSTTAVVDGPPLPVSASTVAVVDKFTASLLNVPSYAAFGHGTMVAGIIHLVAPGAMIMPLKAFGANGTGYISDILRAIYWAVRSNVRVINMSFSTPVASPELQTALAYAVSRQLVCVASAGNGGTRTMVYPAGFDTVMGVASTDLADHRSTFSNYGESLVWVAAPGEAIISTYPFGSYAAGWGTSFSTPFVAGTAALLLERRWSTDQAGASKAIGNAKPIDRDVGNGRLDVYRAVQSIP